MGRLVLGTIGATIGGLLFPGSQFALGIGFAIGSFVGSLLFPQKLPDIVGQRVDNLLINSSAYGAAIPIAYGAVRLGANIIWATDIKETRVEEEVGGGKGGAPSQTLVSFTYSVSFEAAFAEGPAQAIARIWANNKIIYDVRDTNEGPVTQFADNIRIYLGTETQLPDAEVEADRGVGNVPADRGIIKIHFDNLQLEDFGNALPQISAEIFMVSVTAFPSKIANVDPDVPVGIQHNFDRSEVYGITHFNRVSAINSDLKIYALTMGFEFIRSSSIIKPSANSAPTGEVTIDVDEQLYITWFKDSTTDSWIEQIDGNTLVSIKITAYASEVLPPLFAGNYTKINGVPATRILYEGIGTNNIYHVWVGPDRGSVFNVPAVASDANFMDPCIDGTGRAWYIGDDTVINTKKHILVLEGSNVVIYFNYTDSTGRNFKIGQNNQSIWHPQTDTILAAQTSSGSPTEGEILKLDIVTGAILDRVVLPDSTIRFFANQREQSLKFINKSTIWYTTGDQYVEFDPVSMEEVRRLNFDDWAKNIDDSGFFTDITNSFAGFRNIGGDNTFNLNHIDRATASGANTVKSITDNLIVRSGYVPADFDTTNLDDFALQDLTDANYPAEQDVIGFVISQRTSIRSALEILSAGFFFNLIETDFKLISVDRRNLSPPGDIILVDDIGAYVESQEPPKLFEEVIKQEVELPRLVDLVYIDQARDYQDGIQRQNRTSEIINTDHSVTLNLPIVLSPRQAKRIVDISLYVGWISRRTFKVILPPKHVRIDAGDFIQLPVDGANIRVFVESIDYGASNEIIIQVTRDDNAIFDSIIEGITTTVPGSISLIQIIPPSELILMDIPLLRDRDDSAGFYIASGGPKGWPGSIIFRSTDGTDFNLLTGFVSSQNSKIGFARTALPDGITTVFDRDNSVTIRLINNDFSLDSKTELEVLNVNNVALLGEEIIQWVTSVQNADGSFTLSNLLRGRRGTEFATKNHVIGETFTTLSISTTRRQSADVSEKDLERFFRAITIGSDFEGTVIQSFTNTVAGLKPYSPVHITSSREVSPNGTKINWFRRTRIGGAWISSIDVPLSEDTEDYEVDILDESGSIVRTITTTASANGSVVIATSKEAFYHDEDQDTDFGSPGPVHTAIKVYQLSASVGRGFAGDAVI